MDQQARARIRKPAVQASHNPEASEQLWKPTNGYLNRKAQEHSQRFSDPNYRPRRKR